MQNIKRQCFYIGFFFLFTPLPLEGGAGGESAVSIESVKFL